MSFRNKIKKNTPKVALDSIISLVVGSYKTGKTRLWKEVTELHYSTPDEALLICFEKGYETWEMENIIPIHEEGADKDEWKVWEFFRKEVVPGLVKEAKEGRIVKLIGIDTADRCVDACTAWILHKMGEKYAKTFTTLQDISDSTKENGWTLLYSELKKQFDLLTNAGYGIMGLAWTKEKEITLYDGKKFNSIELMMHNTARKIFESQASFICCLFNEVKILDKEGNELEENLKDKKGKEKGTNFHETETMMYFRPSQYISIAGGRYTHLPEKVLYSAENFLQVFEDAVKHQLKKTDKTVEELKTEEEIKKDKKAQETDIEEVFKETNLEELKVEVVTLAKSILKSFEGTKEEKLNFKAEIEKTLGNPNTYESAEQAQKVLEALKKLA